MGGVSDELAEPQGVAGARAAGIDDRGGRRAGGDFVGVDADGDRGRIDVGVEIEEPGAITLPATLTVWVAGASSAGSIDAIRPSATASEPGRSRFDAGSSRRPFR